MGLSVQDCRSDRFEELEIWLQANADKSEKFSVDVLERIGTQ